MSADSDRLAQLEGAVRALTEALDREQKRGGEERAAATRREQTLLTELQRVASSGAVAPRRTATAASAVAPARPAQRRAAATTAGSEHPSTNGAPAVSAFRPTAYATGPRTADQLFVALPSDGFSPSRGASASKPRVVSPARTLPLRQPPAPQPTPQPQPVARKPRPQPQQQPQPRQQPPPPQHQPQENGGNDEAALSATGGSLARTGGSLSPTRHASAGATVTASVPRGQGALQHAWDKFCVLLRAQFTAKELGLLSRDTILNLMTHSRISDPIERCQIEAHWALLQEGRASVGPSATPRLRRDRPDTSNAPVFAPAEEFGVEPPKLKPRLSRRTLLLDSRPATGNPNVPVSDSDFFRQRSGVVPLMPRVPASGNPSDTQAVSRERPLCFSRTVSAPPGGSGGSAPNAAAGVPRGGGGASAGVGGGVWHPSNESAAGGTGLEGGIRTGLPSPRMGVEGVTRGIRAEGRIGEQSADGPDAAAGKRCRYNAPQEDTSRRGVRMFAGQQSPTREHRPARAPLVLRCSTPPVVYRSGNLGTATLVAAINTEAARVVAPLRFEGNGHGGYWQRRREFASIETRTPFALDPPASESGHGRPRATTPRF